MVNRCIAATLVAVGVALSAPSAFAQEEGVTLDPGSPTAKEYALPIEQARRDAGGEGGRATTQAGERAVPLFGEGVRPASGTDGATSRKQAASKSLKSKPKAKATATVTVTPQERAKAQDRITRSLAAASVSGGDSSDGSLVLLLGGSVVMVLGVGLGFVLRRRRRHAGGRGFESRRSRSPYRED